MSLGQNVKGGTYETFLSHTMRVGSKTNGFELGIPNGYIYHIYFSQSLTYAYNGNMDSVY